MSNGQSVGSSRRSYLGMRMRSMSSTLLLLVAMATTGCGFQLAGRYDIDESLSAIFIQAEDPYTPFYRELAERLELAGVLVLNRRTAEAATLTIRRDETGQRVLSVSAQNVPREYEVFYTVSYSVVVDGEIRSGADNLTLARDYTWTETQLLGKEREETLIREALVEQLVQTVLRRLSYAEET